MNIDISRVNLSERDIEDYLWLNPHEVKFYSAHRDEFVRVEYWLGRQVEVPSGIIDLLGVLSNRHPVVVEVKNVPLDGRCVAQVQRYTHDIDRVMAMRYEEWQYKSVYSFIIGPSIDLKTMHECEAAVIFPMIFSTNLSLNVSHHVFTDDYKERVKEKRNELARDDALFSILDRKFATPEQEPEPEPEDEYQELFSEVEALVDEDQE